MPQITRFVAEGLSPRLGRVDLTFGQGSNAVCGDAAPTVLRVIALEAAGDIDEIEAGCIALEMSGDPLKIDVIEESLPPRERAALHSAWIEEFLKNNNRGSGRTVRLRQAWQCLWGSTLERLWADLDPQPHVASATCLRRRILASWHAAGFDPSEEEKEAPVPRDLLALDTRGSGYLAAFDLLGQAALSDADVICVPNPSSRLHFLIAQRVFRALEIASPSAQILAATYDMRIAQARHVQELPALLPRVA